MSAFIAVIAAEMYYKDYLFACSKLQIDPTITYEQSVIDERVENALRDETMQKKERKKLEWLRKYYKKMEGGVFGNKFISRATKEVAKGKLVINYEII